MFSCFPNRRYFSDFRLLRLTRLLHWRRERLALTETIEYKLQVWTIVHRPPNGVTLGHVTITGIVRQIVISYPSMPAFALLIIILAGRLLLASGQFWSWLLLWHIGLVWAVWNLLCINMLLWNRLVFCFIKFRMCLVSHWDSSPSQRTVIDSTRQYCNCVCR